MFILYGRGCGPSGRLLAQHLGAMSGRTMSGQHDVIVRWGNPATINTEATRIVNSSQAIRNCTDKFGALDTMADNDIPVPPFSRNPHEVDLPFLGRSMSHRGGRDIKLYMQRADIEIVGPSDFYVQFVPKKREYRVHVIGRRATKLSRKEFQGTERNLRNAIAWNYRSGFRFMRRDDQTPSIHHFAQLAIPAVQSLGLDFGAVDLFESEAGDWYVTEVNTAPGLVASSARNYARNIRRLLEA